MNRFAKIVSATGLLALCGVIAGAVPAGQLAVPSASAASAAKAITANDILLNDKHIDVGSTLLVRGTTYVPLKPLASAMGYTLAWNAGMKTAELLRPDRRVKLTAGSTGISLNGTAGTIAAAPKVHAGTLYVPLVAGARALGGASRSHAGEIYITDAPRYAVASLNGTSYWVSQADGSLYMRPAGHSEPKRLGQLDMRDTPYLHGLSITAAGPDTVLLELKEKHYAMFNDFENNYQALLQGETVVKQMTYHYNVAATPAAAPGPASTQLYLTDGLVVQYIQADGSLGSPLNLPEITGQDPESGYRFRVEYAAPDVLLARSQQTARLYAVNPATGKAVDLSKQLISPADWPDWERADGSDPYVIPKMLTLTKREGSLLTFVYTPIMDGYAKKKTYTLPLQ
ncbi:copper amine oxidase N-terminal domain-containing protein ['Paenibacillus yunnanensis' Narsing Rao et al. 2020]|uniref:copper amine oxidase N-terminal domain-containing protein n=1 Tax=Paenibacillus tengchongensis TaxID=2608684 RepID=UPI00124EC12D|nr:copper amine oxidase N-terminal domain-containing protein [Paenibacillus tengchongensis]